MRPRNSDAAESLGGVGIVLGAVGGLLMLVASGTGVRLGLGVVGLCVFLVGLLLALVQSWRIARASGVGFVRCLSRCIRRAVSFLFWMSP